ncbi:Non-structural maintenance of chromosomes element 1-like protein [Plecturocebus cupreus]
MDLDGGPWAVSVLLARPGERAAGGWIHDDERKKEATRHWHSPKRLQPPPVSGVDVPCVEIGWNDSSKPSPIPLFLVCLFPGNATVDKLEDFINNINSVLESLYIEIKRGVTEDDGRPIYALVNLATTSVSKMATDFAENELDLFRKALELIIDSESGFASSTNILNLVDQLKGKKMKKKEAEQVLQKFVQNKWLIEKEGEFTLHGRAILEMEQYIQEMYPDTVKICNICHSLLIQGQSCETCGIRMHLPCVAKYFQSNAERRCPHCNDYWPHEIPEVFDPEKEREPGILKLNKKSLRSRRC